MDGQLSCLHSLPCGTLAINHLPCRSESPQLSPQVDTCPSYTDTRRQHRMPHTGALTNWRITEHNSNVALQPGHQWAVAVCAQARRVQNPDHSLERIPDTYLLVMALAQRVAFR